MKMGVLPVLFITACAQNLPPSYLGIDELNGVDANHSFTFHNSETAEHVALEYDAEHPVGVPMIKLDHEPGVVEVKCTPEELQIRAAAESLEDLAARLRAGTLIAGGHHWLCSGNSMSESIHREAVSAAMITDGWLLVNTKEVSPLAFFSQLRLRFRTNMLRQTGQTSHRRELHSVSEGDVLSSQGLKDGRVEDQSNSPTVGRSRALARRQLWWNPIASVGKWLVHTASKAVETAANVANAVAHVVEGVWQLATTGSLGPLSGSKSLAWSYNYGGSLSTTWSSSVAQTKEQAAQQVNIDGSVACTNCFAVATCTVSFEVDIENGNLDKLLLLAEGHAKVQVATQITGSASYENKRDIEVTRLNFADVTLMIAGIPVIISTTVPIHLGYDAKFSANAQVSASAFAQGDIKYGISYQRDRSNGEDFQLISKAGLIADGSVGALGAVDMNLEVYVMPIAQIRVQKIGGPNIGIKAFLESSVGVGTGPCSAGASIAHTSTATSLGLMVTVGAGIEVKLPVFGTIYSKTFSPKTVYSSKQPILAGCLNTNAPPPSASTSASCTDTLGWQDSNGLTCQSYSPSVNQGQPCTHWVDLGQDVNCRQTCGLCAACRDSSQWKDSWGVGCSWYAQHGGCSKYADYGQFENCELTCGLCSSTNRRSLQSAINVDDSAGWAVGTTWRGNLQRTSNSLSCDGVPDFAFLSMQVVDADSIGVMKLLVSISQSNSGAHEMYSNVAQQIWLGNYRDYTSSQLIDIDANQGSQYQSEANYAGSTPMRTTPWTTSRWSCTNCRPSDVTLTLTDPLHCTSVTLTRVPQSKGGVAPPPAPSGGSGSGGGSGNGCGAYDSSISATHPVQQSCQIAAQAYSSAASGCGTQYAGMWIACTAQCCSRRRSLTETNANYSNATFDLQPRSCKLQPETGVDVCPNNQEGLKEVQELTVCTDVIGKLHDIQNEEHAILIIVSVIAAVSAIVLAALLMLIVKGKSRAKMLSVRLGALELQEHITNKLIESPNAVAQI